MFSNSVVEYKARGHYGDNKYRGNTSGLIVKDFLQFAHTDPNALFCDPMEGGATSRDVANEMKIRYKGFDLHSGFNILRDDLGAALGESAQSIFTHPAYYNMIGYSSHPDDLSNNKSLCEFIQKLQLAAFNIYDALKPGGMYGMLMGNWRKNGVYYPLCSLMLTVCPGKLREEIVKIQNNCTSDRKKYAGNNFIPIHHETLYIWEKNASQLLSFSVDFSSILLRLHTITWKNLIRRLFAQQRRPMVLAEIYALVEKNAEEKVKKNPSWRAKVRQVLQDQSLFTRLERGKFTLA